MLKSTNNFKKNPSQSQPHNFLHDSVASLHGSHQHQQIEREGSHIGPHRRDGAGVGVNGGRAGGEGGKDGTGQRDDQTLQADPRIAAQEPFCPPERTAGTLRVAVPASVGAPWDGTPPLRPLPLLRLPVSAAGGGRLRSCSSPPSVQTKSKSPWRD